MIHMKGNTERGFIAASDRRGERIMFRLFPHERERLEQLATQANLSLSELIRRALGIEGGGDG